MFFVKIDALVITPAGHVFYRMAVCVTDVWFHRNISTFKLDSVEIRMDSLMFKPPNQQKCPYIPYWLVAYPSKIEFPLTESEGILFHSIGRTTPILWNRSNRV